MKILSYLEANKCYQRYMNIHGLGFNDLRDYPTFTIAVGDCYGEIIGDFLYHDGERVYVSEKYDWYRKRHQINQLLEDGMSARDVLSFIEL
jgi:hypothetical protein